MPSQIDMIYYYISMPMKMQCCFFLKNMIDLPAVIMMNQKFKSSILLVLATVIWGSTFVAQSVGMDYIGPFTFQAIRCFLAVLALLPVIYLFDGSERKHFIKKWADKSLWLAGSACGVALFAAANLQQVGLIDTAAGKAGFLTAMYIVLVPILGLFLRRKPSFMAYISVGIAVIGIYLLSCVGVSQISIGDVLLLGCALAFAVQITLVDHFAPTVDNLRLNCIQSFVCALLSAVVMIFTETVQMQTVLDCWLPLCYAGILSMGVAYSLQIIGQRYIEPTIAALFMSLESVFAAISGSLVLNERMNTQEIFGCILVFTAILISQIPTKKKICADF